jgi:hypothetical protein
MSKYRNGKTPLRSEEGEPHPVVDKPFDPSILDGPCQFLVTASTSGAIGLVLDAGGSTLQNQAPHAFGTENRSGKCDPPPHRVSHPVRRPDPPFVQYSTQPLDHAFDAASCRIRDLCVCTMPWEVDNEDSPSLSERGEQFQIPTVGGPGEAM